MTAKTRGCAQDILDPGKLESVVRCRRKTGVTALRGQNNVQGSCDMGTLPNVFPGYQSVADPAVKFPLVLTTGRLLSQYHTGTMIRRSEGIDEIHSVAAAEISPRDAKKHDLVNGDKVRLITRRGEIEATAMVTRRSRPGVVFMPFHYKEAAANRLTNPAWTPWRKSPNSKSAP